MLRNAQRQLFATLLGIDRIKMTLEDLGYNSALADFRKEQNLDSLNVGRVISEHKDRYTVKTDASEFEAELIGNLRFAATDRNDLPAVGDWVSISEYGEDKALIHSVFPRKSIVYGFLINLPAPNFNVLSTSLFCEYPLAIIAF